MKPIAKFNYVCNAKYLFADNTFVHSAPEFVVGFYDIETQVFRCQYDHSVIPLNITHFSELPKIPKTKNR